MRLFTDRRIPFLADLIMCRRQPGIGKSLDNKSDYRTAVSERAVVYPCQYSYRTNVRQV